jgi:hypothetical protein
MTERPRHRMTNMLGLLAAAFTTLPASKQVRHHAPRSKHSDRESRRGSGWRPFGERHPDVKFATRDQAAIGRAAAKRERRARARAANAAKASRGAQAGLPWWAAIGRGDRTGERVTLRQILRSVIWR